MDLNLYNPSVIGVNIASSIAEKFSECSPKIVLLHKAKFTNRLRKLEYTSELIRVVEVEGFKKYLVKVDTDIQREKWVGCWTLYFSYISPDQTKQPVDLVPQVSPDVHTENSDLTLEFPCTIFYHHPHVTECKIPFNTSIDVYVTLNENGGYTVVKPFTLNVSKLDSGDFLDWGCADVFVLDRSKLNSYDFLATDGVNNFVLDVSWLNSYDYLI